MWWLQWPALAIMLTAFAVYGNDRRLPVWRIVVAVVVLTAIAWGVDRVTVRLSRLFDDYPQRHPWLFAGSQAISIVLLLAATALLLDYGPGLGDVFVYGAVCFFAVVLKAKRGDRLDDDYPSWTRRDALDDRDDGRRWRTGTP